MIRFYFHRAQGEVGTPYSVRTLFDRRKVPLDVAADSCSFRSNIRPLRFLPIHLDPALTHLLQVRCSLYSPSGQTPLFIPSFPPVHQEQRAQSSHSGPADSILILRYLLCAFAPFPLSQPPLQSIMTTISAYSRRWAFL